MHRILFVCHGNICRSVAAQYILQDMVNRTDTAADFQIDSAATSAEELGNPIYPPMRRSLEKRGIPIGSHRARQLTKSDYNRYDRIIGMDEENMYFMRRILGNDLKHRFRCLSQYTGHPDRMIDDPWYTREFDTCRDEITEGCEGLLQHIKKENIK